MDGLGGGRNQAWRLRHGDLEVVGRHIRLAGLGVAEAFDEEPQVRIVGTLAPVEEQVAWLGT